MLHLPSFLIVLVFYSIVLYYCSMQVLSYNNIYNTKMDKRIFTIFYSNAKYSSWKPQNQRYLFSILTIRICVAALLSKVLSDLRSLTSLAKGSREACTSLISSRFAYKPSSVPPPNRLSTDRLAFTGLLGCCCRTCRAYERRKALPINPFNSSAWSAEGARKVWQCWRWRGV